MSHDLIHIQLSTIDESTNGQASLNGLVLLREDGVAH
jgi:hypothetical protein